MWYFRNCTGTARGSSTGNTAAQGQCGLRNDNTSTAHQLSHVPRPHPTCKTCGRTCTAVPDNAPVHECNAGMSRGFKASGAQRRNSSFPTALTHLLQLVLVLWLLQVRHRQARLLLQVALCESVVAGREYGPSCLRGHGEAGRLQAAQQQQQDERASLSPCRLHSNPFGGMASTKATPLVL